MPLNRAIFLNYKKTKLTEEVWKDLLHVFLQFLGQAIFNIIKENTLKRQHFWRKYELPYTDKEFDCVILLLILNMLPFDKQDHNTIKDQVFDTKNDFSIIKFRYTALVTDLALGDYKYNHMEIFQPELTQKVIIIRKKVMKKYAGRSQSNRIQALRKFEGRSLETSIMTQRFFEEYSKHTWSVCKDLMLRHDTVTPFDLTFAIDEQMLPFESFFYGRQYIANKPNRFGVLLRSIVNMDWMFLVGFFQHGRDPDSQKTTMVQIIKKLLEPLYDESTPPKIIGRKFTVCSDNFYSCEATIKYFQEKHIEYIATIQQARAVKLSPTASQESPVGAIETIETPDRLALSTKQVKKNKRLNVVGVNVDVDQAKELTITKSARNKIHLDSQLISKYKQCYKGVDICDQYFSYVKPRRRVYSALHRVIYFWLQAALYNTLQYAKRVYQCDQSFVDFTFNIAKLLYAEFAAKYANSPTSEETMTRPRQAKIHFRVRFVDKYPDFYQVNGKYRPQCEFPDCKTSTSTFCNCGFECCRTHQSRHTRAPNTESIRQRDSTGKLIVKPKK